MFSVSAFSRFQEFRHTSSQDQSLGDITSYVRVLGLLHKMYVAPSRTSYINPT